MDLVPGTRAGGPDLRYHAFELDLRCTALFHPLEVGEDGRAPCGHSVAQFPPVEISGTEARQLLDRKKSSPLRTDPIGRWQGQVIDRLRECSSARLGWLCGAPLDFVAAVDQATWGLRCLQEVCGLEAASLFVRETARELLSLDSFGQVPGREVAA